MTDWLLFPTVTAPSPRGLSETDTFGISNAFISKNSDNRRCSPIFQLWAHVIGNLPPINLIKKLEDEPIHPSLTTLHDSVACFSGICRPHDNEEDGSSVLVYVLNPEVSIKFEESMACQATAIKVPKNTVLTVQVRPDYAGQGDPTGVNGIVTRVEFVSSSNDNPSLPKNFDVRYQQTLWQK